MPEDICALDPDEGGVIKALPCVAFREPHTVGPPYELENMPRLSRLSLPLFVAFDSLPIAAPPSLEGDMPTGPPIALAGELFFDGLRLPLAAPKLCEKSPAAGDDLFAASMRFETPPKASTEGEVRLGTDIGAGGRLAMMAGGLFEDLRAEVSSAAVLTFSSDCAFDKFNQVELLFPCMVSCLFAVFSSLSLNISCDA